MRPLRPESRRSPRDPSQLAAVVRARGGRCGRLDGRAGRRTSSRSSASSGPLLIAPAVIFVLVVVGVPLGWAIYLSLTDAIGGSLSGKFVGLDNFTDAVARPELPQRAREHADHHVLRAGDRRRRRGDPLALPRPRLPRQVVRPLPRHPAVGGAGRARHDRLALDLRLALQRRELDAEGDAPVGAVCCAVRRRTAAARTTRRSGSATTNLAMFAIIIVHAWRIAARSRHHLHRRPGVDPDRGRGRGEDRRRRGR